MSYSRIDHIMWDGVELWVAQGGWGEGKMCLDWRMERRVGLMSPLRVHSGGWLICLQEVQMERGSLMVPNGQEENLAAESKHLLWLSQVNVLGHLRADGQNSQRFGRHSAQDLCILLYKQKN